MRFQYGEEAFFLAIARILKRKRILADGEIWQPHEIYPGQKRPHPIVVIVVIHICIYRNISNAPPHERNLQSCSEKICNAVNGIRRDLSDAAVLASQHYTADANLSCTTPKTRALVLQIYQLDYGVGTFLLRIKFPIPTLGVLVTDHAMLSKNVPTAQELL